MYPKTPQNIYNGLGAPQPLKSPSSRNIFNKDQSIALQRTSKLLNYFEILPKERMRERERERKGESEPLRQQEGVQLCGWYLEKEG